MNENEKRLIETARLALSELPSPFAGRGSPVDVELARLAVEIVVAVRSAKAPSSAALFVTTMLMAVRDASAEPGSVPGPSPN